MEGSNTGPGLRCNEEATTLTTISTMAVMTDKKKFAGFADCNQTNMALFPLLPLPCRRFMTWLTKTRMDSWRTGSHDDTIQKGLGMFRGPGRHVWSLVLSTLGFLIRRAFSGECEQGAAT